jgi:cytochrome c biogenesis protein CcmG, thiol:disulfide interchange protein DsbE
MSGVAKGALFVTVVGFLAVIYFFFFVYKAPDKGTKSYHGEKVTNYLDSPPEIPDPAARMQVGQPAPVFSYAALDGRVVHLTQFKGNKPVVLDFWATWCPPCRMEIPLLQRFADEYGGKVEIIAISSEDAGKAGEIRSFAHNEGLSFDVMHDPTGTIDAMYPHNAIPFLVMIDKNGKVIKTETGYSPGLGEELKGLFGL